MYHGRALCLFFNDPPPTELSPLSLHDALPISRELAQLRAVAGEPDGADRRFQHIGQQGHGCSFTTAPAPDTIQMFGGLRSEEHTSELQSRFDLVCRLLLEKKTRLPPWSYTSLR